jgi:hypothetical protein
VPLARASAYDYTKAAWEPLRVRAVSGVLRAAIPTSPGYLVGGVVQVRLRASYDDVEVYGAFPELSARAAASRTVTRTFTVG